MVLAAWANARVALWFAICSSYAINKKNREEVEMFRSVTESGRAPIRQRINQWTVGVFVAAGIVSLLILGFGVLMSQGS